MSRSPRLPALAVLSACALLVGCGMIATGAVALGRNPEKRIKALYNPSGKAVAVIPFAYEEHRPFETEHGLVLADTVERELLARVKKVRIVPVGKARNYFTDTPPAEVDPKVVAEMLGADVVITGQIRSVRLADNLDHMDAELRVEAYDERASAIILKETLSARYPEGHSFSPTELDRQEAVRGVVIAAGRAVARLFYDHSVRNIPTSDVHGGAIK